MSRQWWQEWTARVGAAHSVAVENALSRLAADFAEMARARGLGGILPRRPVLGLTLRFRDGKAVLRPAWWKGPKFLYTANVEGEIWLPHPVTREPRRAWRFAFIGSRQPNEPGVLESGTVYRSQADAALAALVRLLSDWETDPAAVLARSADHCCLCGRVLSDPASRGRGIGPECLGHVPSRLRGVAVAVAWHREAATLAGE